MQRGVTNIIRFVMDELLPPALRDNRYFVYPFFRYWFKNKNLQTYMEFKSRLPEMSDAEYRRLYQDLDCRATDRATDLSRACVKYIFDNIDASCSSLLDVGCGRQFLLKSVQKRTRLSLCGCDLLRRPAADDLRYVQSDAERLPFRSHSFDVVTCCHTLEHVCDINAAVGELKRVARKQLIIVVPRQRYYYYSLDLHVHFFPSEHAVRSLVNIPAVRCSDIQGDWVAVCAIGNNTPDGARDILT